MKLTLRHPLPMGSKTLEALTFRDYTMASDYLAFDRRGGVAQSIALIASMTGTDETVIERLRGIDFRAAQKVVDTLMAQDEAGAQEGEDLEKKSEPS